MISSLCRLPFAGFLEQERRLELVETQSTAAAKVWPPGFPRSDPAIARENSSSVRTSISDSATRPTRVT
ncbi:MAG: hypothetical protein RJA70_3140 [Pseudomonadota bacterium]|jgi:hypothetical protein